MGNNGSEGDKNNNYSSVNTDKHNINKARRERGGGDVCSALALQGTPREGQTQRPN